MANELPLRLPVSEFHCAPLLVHGSLVVSGRLATGRLLLESNRNAGTHRRRNRIAFRRSVSHCPAMSDTGDVVVVSKS
jgi:hypothetical protein